MIMVAKLFPPRIAATILGKSVDWLSRNRSHVMQMAAQCGVDLDAVRFAIDVISPPDPTPPAEPIAIDIIVPFWAGDAQWLSEGLETLIAQRYCRPVIHVASDGAEWPELSDEILSRILRYEYAGGLGPYRIANDLVRRGLIQTEWLAIQDADDISSVDRCWRQVQTLIATGADMISSAAENFLQPGVTEPALIKRLSYEPIIKPGKPYEPNPRGRCVNTTRTMRLDWFRSINGFFNMRCTGDFQLDNRARYSGAKIVDDQTVLARRRLHTGSMTGGVFTPETPQRKHDRQLTIHARDMMQASPTIETAATMGGLFPVGSEKYLKR